MRELRNAKITHVSYVDKAANLKKFFLTKAEGDTNFELEVAITKANDESKRLVYGVVYEPERIDAHGDYMTADEIEKAAHDFLINARNIDVQHNFKEGFGDVVESYIAKQDDLESGIIKGSWVLVTKATPEVWDAIQKGDITGYSMAGTAEVIEKAGKKISSNRRNMLLQMFDSLKQLLADTEDTSSNNSVDAEEEVTQEMADMMKEQLDSIAKSLETVTSRIEALEKAAEKPEEVIEKQEEVTEEVVTEEVAKEEDKTNELLESLVKSVEALTSRLETVEKSRGISKSVNTEEIKQEEVKKSEVPHWSSIL